MDMSKGIDVKKPKAGVCEVCDTIFGFQKLGFLEISRKQPLGALIWTASSTKPQCTFYLHVSEEPYSLVLLELQRFRVGHCPGVRSSDCLFYTSSSHGVKGGRKVHLDTEALAERARQRRGSALLAS